MRIRTPSLPFCPVCSTLPQIFAWKAGNLLGSYGIPRSPSRNIDISIIISELTVMKGHFLAVAKLFQTNTCYKNSKSPNFI
jgi:hypothetical protein